MSRDADDRRGLRLSHDEVESIEIDNIRKGTVAGWLAMRDEDLRVHLWLSGDATPGLEGRRVRFATVEPDTGANHPRHSTSGLHGEQIGPAGRMFLRRPSGGGAKRRARLRVILEWFSQNGHVLVEADVAELEQGAGEPLAVGRRRNDELEDGAYESFETGEDRVRSRVDRVLDEFSGVFDEVPVGSLLGSRMGLVAPNDVEGDGSSGILLAHVNRILARLAREWIAVDICEHFDTRDTYRFLWRLVHDESITVPRRRGRGVIERFLTHEACPACRREIGRLIPELDTLWTDQDAWLDETL